MKFFSWLLILFGIACYIVGGYYIWLRYDPNRLAFSNYHYAVNIPVNSKRLPVRITIQSAHIDIPIFPEKIANGIWQTTDNGAAYLATSPIPGTVGNSIIYAHDFASLFGNLVTLRPGEEVTIQFSDRSIEKFTVMDTSIVSPSQSSILAPTKDRRITLYTCTGWFDSRRFVAVAVLDTSGK